MGQNPLPPDIKAALRLGELQARETRRNRLLAQLKNEDALLLEDLSPEHQEVHRLAIKRLEKAKLHFWLESQPSYWKRLWAALTTLPRRKQEHE